MACRNPSAPDSSTVTASTPPPVRFLIHDRSAANLFSCSHALPILAHGFGLCLLHAPAWSRPSRVANCTASTAALLSAPIGPLPRASPPLTLAAQLSRPRLSALPNSPSVDNPFAPGLVLVASRPSASTRAPGIVRPPLDCSVLPASTWAPGRARPFRQSRSRSLTILQVCSPTMAKDDGVLQQRGF
jgi:hypothetical protein